MNPHSTAEAEDPPQGRADVLDRLVCQLPRPLLLGAGGPWPAQVREEAIDRFAPDGVESQRP